MCHARPRPARSVRSGQRIADRRCAAAGARGFAEGAGLGLADEAFQVWLPHVVCDPRSCAHLKSPTVNAIWRVCHANAEFRISGTPMQPLSLLLVVIHALSWNVSDIHRSR